MLILDLPLQDLAEQTHHAYGGIAQRRLREFRLNAIFLYTLKWVE